MGRLQVRVGWLLVGAIFLISCKYHLLAMSGSEQFRRDTRTSVYAVETVNKPLILVYSLDHSLLETRSLVLERAGPSVVRAGEDSEARRLVVERSPSVVTICHSVPQHDRDSFVAWKLHDHPEVSCIVLTDSGRPHTLPLQISIQPVFDGPQAFIDAVSRLAAHPQAAPH
jgi:hypothetical protein